MGNYESVDDIRNVANATNIYEIANKLDTIIELLKGMK